MTTSPASASVIAARSPAMPLPITRKSPRTPTDCYPINSQIAQRRAGPALRTRRVYKTRPGLRRQLESQPESRQPRIRTRVIDPIRIDVNAGTRSSPIWIGDGLTEDLGGLLDRHGVGARRFIVSNPVVWRLHGNRLRA